MASDSLSSFSVEFLKVLFNEKKDQNIFYSPLSILTAFSMLLMGARNKSSNQLIEAFKLKNMSTADIHDEIGKLLLKCTTPLGSFDNLKLLIANGLFNQHDYTIDDNFRKGLVKYYKSEMTEINFQESAAAAKTINKWIEDKTNNKIKDMFNDNSFNSFTRLVLANAIYFKDNFKDAFPDNGTSKKPFHRSNSTKEDVDMMTTSGDYDYVEDSISGTKMLIVPFKNFNFKFLLLLPLKRFGLDECVQKLGATTIHDLVNAAKLRIVSNLQLPKFKINTEMDLTKLMPLLGVNDVFDSKTADLSGISPGDQLFVDTAVHKTFLDINEHGVEAAAATAMSISLMCMPIFENETPIEFIVDEPFMMAVYHSAAEAVVFFGKINRP